MTLVIDNKSQTDTVRHDRPGDVSEMPSPRRIGHISILTDEKFEEMVQFYCTMFGGQVINQVPGVMAFPSFDDEHHRFAIIKRPGVARKSGETLGLHHVAYSYASLGEILFVYSRMKDIGVTPRYCVNHGTTTSMYYNDPDGNELEIFVDNFDTLAEVVHYKKTVQFLPGFAPMSESTFDPDKLVSLFESGVPDSVLRDRREVLRLVAEGKL